MRIINLLFLLLAVPCWAQSGHISLSVAEDDITLGSRFYVDIEVVDMPNVYGADIEIVYDPDVLTVIDKDENKDGVQIEASDFFNTRYQFILKNHVNKKEGRIQFVMSQINPAKDVNGSGILGRVQFEASSMYLPTEVAIVSAKFGSQDGKVSKPEVATPKQIHFQSSAPRVQKNSSLVSVFIAITFIVLFLTIFARVIRKRSVLATE
ncbi:cohesin domain-containing protein [Pseudoalteromonas aurantia]|uniref:Cohesin domain-containing protein n=1 Tax=Pseudoalteromonas aurantia 208 TaxID=1314867 RepID=A0ABR9EC04_9GAMM|nr:cohesin domain-containing protein [Pseudoalteromonas aurantia]MBE0368519.1 hypothetical protein [Pseudoalteromonas aurantia 208]